jgi:hypothetical protein
MKTWAWNERYVLCMDEEGLHGLVPVNMWKRAVKRYIDYDIE